jgi:hypothetical protein
MYWLGRSLGTWDPQMLAKMESKLIKLIQAELAI